MPQSARTKIYCASRAQRANERGHLTSRAVDPSTTRHPPEVRLELRLGFFGRGPHNLNGGGPENHYKARHPTSYQGECAQHPQGCGPQNHACCSPELKPLWVARVSVERTDVSVPFRLRLPRVDLPRSGCPCLPPVRLRHAGSFSRAWPGPLVGGGSWLRYFIFHSHLLPPGGLRGVPTGRRFLYPFVGIRLGYATVPLHRSGTAGSGAGQASSSSTSR